MREPSDGNPVYTRAGHLPDIGQAHLAGHFQEWPPTVRIAEGDRTPYRRHRPVIQHHDMWMSAERGLKLRKVLYFHLDAASMHDPLGPANSCFNRRTPCP